MSRLDELKDSIQQSYAKGERGTYSLDITLKTDPNSVHDAEWSHEHDCTIYRTPGLILYDSHRHGKRVLLAGPD